MSVCNCCVDLFFADRFEDCAALALRLLDSFVCRQVIMRGPAGSAELRDC